MRDLGCLTNEQDVRLGANLDDDLDYQYKSLRKSIFHFVGRCLLMSDMMSDRCRNGLGRISLSFVEEMNCPGSRSVENMYGAIGDIMYTE